MRTWLANMWRAVSSGFWFVPGLFLLAGIFLAILAPEADRHWAEQTPKGLRTTAVTARATLTALCSAMFTVTGVVFSTTTVALSITSNQLGPRLLRNFLGQLVTQVTLGVCLFTSVYCLILLRRIDENEGDLFVPHGSVLMASVLGLLTLMAIVYFIHRVARSMQAQNVASDVADELDQAVQRMFPEETNHDVAESHADSDWLVAWEDLGSQECEQIVSASDGYLQAIDYESLISHAEEHGATYRLTVRPGDYVRAGDPFLEHPATSGESSYPSSKLVRRCFLLGNQRTTQQDVECAVNELVEIALRALSPGVNDPFTAITCVDRLSGALRRLATRRMPTGQWRDSEQQLRIVERPLSLTSVVEAAFNPIRQSARGDVAVTIRLLEALGAIDNSVTRDSDHDALLCQAELIVESAHKQDFVKHDMQDILDRYERLSLA